MRKLLFAGICLALSLPNIAIAQYDVPRALVYATRWCYDFNAPPYDSSGPYCTYNLGEDPPRHDCINFVSQILQNGCMALCGNWVCHETPAVDPACAGHCFVCNQRSTIIRVVADAIPYFGESSYWERDGPLTVATIDSPYTSGGPDYWIWAGDVICINYRDGTGGGHAYWVCADEDTNPPYLRCDLAAHTGAHCPSEHYTLRYSVDHYWKLDYPNCWIYIMYNVGSPRCLRSRRSEIISMEGSEK